METRWSEAKARALKRLKSILFPSVPILPILSED